MTWTYDAVNHRYVETDDDGDELVTLAVLSAALLRMRNRVADNQEQWGDTISDMLLAGTITLTMWEREMRDRITAIWLALYAAGRGGLSQLGDGDLDAISTGLVTEFTYLREFTSDIAAGSLTPDQIRARARAYMTGGRQAFEKGKGGGYGVYHLPQWPRDGQTLCASSCHCWLRFVPLGEGNGVDVYWKHMTPFTKEDPCPECRELTMTWNPFHVAADKIAGYNA